ncbi:MAG: nucleotidyltransferase family protein [Lachnospiraceae bacterium]|nr:nucleotidyltransferase family protein [Robinsoniella sp.]MDY3767944.1 nucleotidyltransferase family protein [Lachnospiraceae bacterium]
MNTTEIFLVILDAAIHNKPAVVLENEKCMECLAMAQAHNVLPLVFEKLCEREEFLALPAFEAYLGSVMGIVAAQAQRTDAFLNLYQGFLDAEIHPIVIKGIVCRQLYGELCDHRPSGDEDILIRKADFEQTRAVMEAQGFVPEREEITENQLEELQEITFYQSSSGLTVEVHTNPIGKENDILYRMNDCFQKVFDHPKKMTIDGTTVWTMNDTDHFLFLILHTFKHMLGCGFGIRQVMDVLLYYERHELEIDIVYVMEMLEKVRAKKFFSDLIHLGNQYLGFHFTPLEERHYVEELLAEMMKNGTFGNVTQAQQIAGTMTVISIECANRKTGAKWIRMIFPSQKKLMSGYPELLEKPWLLPICWVKRWIKFLRRKTENRGQWIVESIKISERRIELLKKYDVL